MEELENFRNSKQFAEFEKMSDEELETAALTDLGIDSAEYKKEQEVILGKGVKEGILDLGYFADKFEVSCRGKEVLKSQKSEEKYVQVGKALAGEGFIKKVASLIRSFANRPMLVSEKSNKDFNMQFEDMFYTISDMTLEVSNRVSVTASRSILKEVKDIFWNIGDILTKTGQNMSKIFGNMEDKYDDVDGELKSQMGKQ